MSVSFQKFGASREEIESRDGIYKQMKDSYKKILVDIYCQSPPSEDDLSSLTSEGQHLPNDYADFLKNFNGGFPSKTILETKDNERVLNEFLAVKAPKNFSSSIQAYIKIYKDRIPVEMLPIASAGSGDLILLSIGGSEKGAIFYWDHNWECDEGDASNFYENIEKVADSFSDLLEKLKPDE